MEQLGRYQLGDEIGSGPYSVTYDAQADGQRCAVKVLTDAAVPSDPGRREGLARALAGLKDVEHPSVVKILDGGDAEGTLFLATEFMGCATLAQKIQQQSSLPEQQVVLFVRQVAQALDKARDQGYCHGSLNTNNVFVVSEEKVKVADFALGALVADPPDAGDMADAGDGGADAGLDEWVTAEDLLRTKGKRASTEKLDDDFVGLAVLMMEMLGVDVPAQGEEESVDAYRNGLLRSSYPAATAPAAGLSTQTGEVVRRLLTPGGFGSPGEVVVELASAMLLGRTFARSRMQPAAEPASASATAQVRAEPEAAEEGDEFGLLELDLASSEQSEFTPFFIWSDRHSGRFFVIHEGEQLSIGRDPDVCDVTLMDPAVSRKHCSISRKGGVITLDDPGSSNGTFVNGERIQTAEVKPGDRLRIGSTRVYLSLPSAES